jgi:hypothetical protein
MLLVFTRSSTKFSNSAAESKFGGIPVRGNRDHSTLR